MATDSELADKAFAQLDEKQLIERGSLPPRPDREPSGTSDDEQADIALRGLGKLVEGTGTGDATGRRKAP